MELFSGLAIGFQAALTPMNLLYCLFGVFVGTLIGVLPGLGPAATVAMLMPASFVLPPVSSLIMLAGIYYGAQYGGSTTSILVNLPGEASSIVTTLDGYQMALQGRAGVALATSAIGSFFAGTVCTVIIALFAPPLAGVALKFGPAEYFALMLLGLVASVVLARGSLLKAVGMIVLGLILGLIGTDVNSGAQRYTFGITELMDGVGFVTVAMGMFGLGEIILNLEREGTAPPGHRQDHQPHADARGLAADDRAHPPRDPARLLPRHPARRGRAARLLRGLLGGEEGLDALGRVREGGHRGGGRARVRQQRRGPGFLHPHAHARDSHQPRHGPS